jgi:hypothetical protein
MPKLTDPTEFALIREMYFEDHKAKNKDLFDLDPDELIDRMVRRHFINEAR